MQLLRTQNRQRRKSRRTFPPRLICRNGKADSSNHLGKGLPMHNQPIVKWRRFLANLLKFHLIRPGQAFWLPAGVNSAPQAVGRYLAPGQRPAIPFLHSCQIVNG